MKRIKGINCYLTANQIGQIKASLREGYYAHEEKVLAYMAKDPENYDKAREGLKAHREIIAAINKKLDKGR